MTDLELLDQVPVRPMTGTEQALADSFYNAIQAATNNTARSLQSAGHRIGVSDLGHCSERVRRSLAGETPADTDNTKMFIGTAMGDHVEAAFVTMFPKMIRQSEVEITLYGDTGTYVLNGHPDLIDPAGAVWDVKTVNGLEKVRRTGPNQQQQFQRHCYAKAAHAAGMFDPEVRLTDVVVGNIWFDRSAEESKPYIQSENYDERVVQAATMWVDDVVYAYLHGEEARKEPPIQMCAKTCGFYLDCRAGQGGPSGLIDDPEELAAVSMYNEGTELERQGKRLKNQAKVALNGVEGSTGHYQVSWSKVGASEVSYHRDPYLRLNVRKIR